VISKVTTPAPKYGPTGTYGDCEADKCHSVARMTCESCGGEYCLGHSQHSAHVETRAGNTNSVNTR
jgi:hypothetical protein